MDYIQLLQKRINGINDNTISALIDEEFWKLKNEIVVLQEQQLMTQKGFDDKKLYSRDFSGVYSEKTEEIADNEGLFKRAGSPYNFKWTDSFVKGLGIQKKHKGWEIFSSGIKEEEKKDFFESYDNMFGLNSDNTATIESEVLYYVFEKIVNRLYL